MWMRMIDRIIIEDLGFTTTTHDRCIYTKQVDGKTILMLRQVDDFMLGCTYESIARNIHDIIGTKIRFKTEEEEDIVPFEWLDIVEDYNGVDIKQTDIYIKMDCAGYIHRLLMTHGWDPESSKTKKPEPSPDPSPDSSPDPSQDPSPTPSLFQDCMKSSKPIASIPADCIEQLIHSFHAMAIL
jgi:hypothetical protein